jgi:predicted phosphodiesterase
MRYAIVSDIHSNWEAFEAVLQECNRPKVEIILCAGDIVGYGASPKECLNAVRSLKMVTVAGNHDWAVCGRLDPTYFTDDGKAAAMWTRKRVSVEDIQYLASLQLSLQNAECAIVHASLNMPERFTYLTDVGRASSTFSLMQPNVCFIGHTHTPRIFVEQNGKIFQSDILEMEIDVKSKYIVNVGSVGQPRDGNPMASYCIYDSKQHTLAIHRVNYDIKGAQQKIIAAGLPEKLAIRLAVGQ